MSQSNTDPVVFVVPGDLHLTKAGMENHQAALHGVAEINRLIKPDFVQFIGDNVQHAAEEEFDLFHDLAERLNSPWYALVGDHDVHGDREAVRFRKRIGETYGSTKIGGVRFIRLNTQEAPKRVGISLDQIAWMRAELAAARQNNESVVLFQHNYPYQIWEDFAGPGIDEWRVLVQTYRITAIFSGHTHYGQTANDGRNVCVATRSIGDPEGGAPGYTVVYVNGDDLAITYRTVEERGPLVLVTHPRDILLATDSLHVVRGSDKIKARVWSEQAVAGVRVRIDDGPWRFMQQSGELDWETVIPGEQLSKGSHRLTVDACDQDGLSAEQTVHFPFDKTGRFTAVPAARPVATSTNFC